MDPFTAIGVAAAALQFFDVARDVLREYRTRRERSQKLTRDSFEKTTQDLMSCMEAMRRTTPVATSRSSRDNPVAQHEAVSIINRMLCAVTDRHHSHSLSSLMSANISPNIWSTR
jgi:hypothetical protein